MCRDNVYSHVLRDPASIFGEDSLTCPYLESRHDTCVCRDSADGL
jgi:hypothetical protein